MENKTKRWSAADGMLNSKCCFEIFMDYFTSFRLLIHLLELITFEQNVCSTKIDYANALSLGANS